MNRKRILCLDFDGVCHSYTSGWKGAAVIPDPPVPGMWEFLREATLLFEVDVFSSRTSQQGGLVAMRNWFRDHAETAEQAQIAAELVFPVEKPPAFVGLDDRVLTFRGTWPTMYQLDTFTPWNAEAV